ncbi:BamA/TamA family outer membrane protein, partial [Klebsiella pneumoniae]
SVGFGFRIKIPFLGSAPIALDFGFPIRKQRGDDTQVLSFSLTRDF